MFLEVARRWMWVFFRVETEWGEYSFFPYSAFVSVWLAADITSVRNNRGPAPDDILLGEFTGKKDQD